MTATITEQPTTEAIEARIRHLDFPETAVNTPSTGLHDRGEQDAKLIYVTGISDIDPGREEWVGTIRRLVPAPSGNGWLDRETPGRPGASFDRYNGAVVCPEPVNGHYYRSIGDDRFLVRFNDDEHRTDRGREEYPWTLLRGRDESVWPVPNDGLLGMTLWPYVEVEFTEAAAEETAVRTAETEEAAAEEPEVATVGNTDQDPTFGKALAEEDGTVLLDPEMVTGGAYLVWDGLNFEHDYSNVYLVRFVGDDVTDSSHFVTYGYFDWNSRASEPRWSSDYYAAVSTVGNHWAKAAYGKPEATENTSDVTALEALADEELTRFREFNRLSNQIAKTAGWCGEYDRIVSGVGMRGRYKSYDVNVSATFTFENRNVSGAVDSAVAENHGLDSSLSISTIEYSATMDVTVRVDNATDADDAEEKVGTSDVEAAIEAMALGLSNIDVSDYEIESTDRVDGGDDDDEDDDED